MVESLPSSESGAAAQSGRPCPSCKKPGTLAYRPFCSKRCADIDLHRWMAGAYAIPAAPEEDEDDDARAAPGPRHE